MLWLIFAQHLCTATCVSDTCKKNPMSSGGDQNPQDCFLEWMNIQEEDHSELVQALSVHGDGDDHNNRLRRLVKKNIQHFEDYAEKRIRIARNHSSCYFAPSWCSSLEGSMLWAAGCRPTTFIRLLYILCGHEIESRLSEYFQGSRTGNLGELSALQLNLANSLHAKTIEEEDKLSSRIASLQEQIADHPIAIIAKEMHTHNETNREIDNELDGFSEALSTVLKEGDKLRLNTVKELINILTPIQAVEFLAASKKLRLCIRAWGQKREHQHVTNQDQT